MATTALTRMPTGQGGVGRLWKQYTNLKQARARMIQKSEGVVEGVIHSLEVQASAFVFGAIQGFYLKSGGEIFGRKTDKPGAHIFGAIPLELGVGISLHVMSLLGVGGRYAGHMRSFGDGAMAAYMAALGAGWGQKFRAERDAGGKRSTAGANLRDELRELLE